MGGFALELDEEEHLSVDLSTPKRMFVTTAGLLKLAEGGHFLTPKPETIADKSKADGIAKRLVISQVTWMVIQVHHFFGHIACLLHLYKAGFKISVYFTGLGPQSFRLSSDIS